MTLSMFPMNIKSVEAPGLTWLPRWDSATALISAAWGERGEGGLKLFESGLSPEVVIMSARPKVE